MPAKLTLDCSFWMKIVFAANTLAGCSLPTGLLNPRWAMDDPDYGLHFWWNPNVRLTGSARYWLTTEGASANDWVYGIGVAYFR